MCGRFSQFYTWQELQALYAIHDQPASNLEPRDNISPTDRAGIVGIFGVLISAFKRLSGG
jgi:putative SOS response-associated peptidase YedK